MFPALTGVVLCGNIIGQIMIEDESEQTIEQSQIDLLVNLRQHGFHQDIALSFAGFPNVSQIVDTLTPLWIDIS